MANFTPSAGCVESGWRGRLQELFTSNNNSHFQYVSRDLTLTTSQSQPYFFALLYFQFPLKKDTLRVTGEAIWLRSIVRIESV